MAVDRVLIGCCLGVDRVLDFGVDCLLGVDGMMFGCWLGVDWM